MTTAAHARRQLAFPLLFVLLWSTGFIAAKYGLAYAPPLKFLFVRFLYHVDNGAWRLIHIHLKSENEHPLPKEWVHIYPK